MIAYTVFWKESRILVCRVCRVKHSCECSLLSGVADFVWMISIDNVNTFIGVSMVGPNAAFQS